MVSKRDTQTPIPIYNDTTLADSVLERLNERQTTILDLKSRQQCSNSTTEAATVSVITTTMAVNRWLSAYGPGVFSDLTVSPSKPSKSLQIAISRVGPVTGDVQIQLKGNNDNIKKILMFFLQKTQYHTGKLSLVALVDRYTALTAPEGLASAQFKCSKSPYGLLPGYLLSISSLNPEEVVHFCSTLAQTSSSVDTSKTSTKFNSPQKFTVPELKQGIAQLPLTERRSRGKFPGKNSNLTKSTIVSTSDTGTSTPPQEQSTDMTMKLLEFNRQEVTYLIGRHGSKINKLRLDTGATIRVVPISNTGSTPAEALSVFKSKPRNHRLTQYIRLSGPKTQVKKALALIEADIYQFRMDAGNRY